MPRIDKLLPRSLNTDDDERLIKSTQMTDAQNIRVSVDVEEDALVLKNAWGNTLRSSSIENGSMPSGVNVAIGAVADDASAQIYYFVYNGSNNHTIFRYDQNAKKTFIVYQDAVLNFSKEGFITASIVTLSNNDTLLYFNDGVTEPKKINATIAEQTFSGVGGYDSTFSSGTVQERTNYITVAKQPPLSPPTISFSTNTKYSQNDIFDKNFQFAYQYVYFDGEHSALSPYSKLSVSDNQLKDGFLTFEERTKKNQIDITVKQSNLDVKEINVYARLGDKDSAFFLIETIDNNHGTDDVVVPFRNESNYIGLSALTQDKFYDNVPQKADSQAISQGRLFYGGYTEGYNNVDIDATAVPNYYAKPDTFSIQVNKFDDELEKGAGIEIDLSSLPATVETDSKVLLSFSFNDGAIMITNELGKNRDFTFFRSTDTSEISVNRNKTGGLSLNLSQSNKLEALSGLRYKIVTSGATAGAGGNEVGLNVEGTLNGPPTIRFAVQKNTSDTREDIVPIRRIDDGIKLISSGIQVRKVLEIPAGTTLDGVMTIISEELNGLYPIQYSPQAGEAGFSGFRTGGDTLANEETGAFFGYGDVWLREINRNENPTTGATAAGKMYFKLSISKATLALNKLTFGTKQAEVLEADGTSSQFDIIEANINGLLSAIPTFSRIPNMQGRFISNQAYQHGKGAVVKRNGSYVTQGGSFLIQESDMEGNRAFKSGASHEFGIIYYDDKGRPSGVQPLSEDPFIEHTNNRSGENNLDGRADIVFRILKNEAPEWAERYGIVYAGQGSIKNKLQYSIGGAYLALNDDTQGSFGSAKTIYLSLNTLQSKANSYDNQQGALINYGFAEGDRLRIVRYGDDVKSTADFRISRFDTLLADISTNPLLDRSSKAAIQNTTGDFLVIEDNGTEGFDISSILDGNSNWNNKCVVEIYRESDAFEETFYYQIGENRAVNSDRTHQSERVTSTGINSKIISQSGDSVVIETQEKVYKGDLMDIQGNGVFSAQVGNVSDNPSTDGYSYKVYLIDRTATYTPGATSTSGAISNPDVVVQFNQGDSYYRLRTLYYGSAPRKGDVWRNMAQAFSQNAIVDFIEDPRVSDFYPSEFCSLGKTFAYLPDAKRIKRYGSITYSDPFAFEANKLGLSSFNITTQNFKDLSYDYGSLKSLIPYDEFLYVIHERRSGIIPIGRNILTANDGESLTATNKVVGPVKYYVGEYGVNNNPESVAYYRGSVFFVDAKAGKVLRINFQSGMSIISEIQVDSFFKSKMFATSTSAKNRRYRAGMDRENYEYIISSPALFTSALSIDNTCASTTASGNGRTNSGGTIINVTAVYDNSLTFDFNNDTRKWECSEENWEDSGKAMVLIDQLTNNPIVGISEDLSPVVTGANANIPTLMTSSAYQAFHTGVYSQSTEEITPNTGLSGSSFTIATPSETLPSFTIAYDVRSNFWTTRYSYIAEEFAGLSDRIYTFKDGAIYEHNPSANRNTFYGVAGDSIIECISNFNPSMVKAYEAISLEGNNSSWTATLSNSDQTSTIASSIWEEKEGFYYGAIHQDSTNNVDYTATANISSVSGTSEVFGLGSVSSITGSDAFITFKNTINNMSFPLGVTTALFKISGSNLVPLQRYAVSINSEKKLECNATITGLSADDQIVLIANSAIEGDTIRDYYLKAKLVNSSTSAHELYAINFIYNKSNLHNQQGK